MTSGAQTRQGQFVKVRRGFHGILVCSRVFMLSRWIVPEKIPRDVALRCWPYLVAKASHVGFDVDGLACPLHRLVPSCNNGWWCLTGGYEAQCVIKFHIEHVAFTRICSP
jgi:hypothetical protein